MSIYRQLIIKATGCSYEQAIEVEEIMRHDVFHSTLDHLSRKEFNAGAVFAWEMYKFQNSPEGEAIMKELYKGIMN